MHTLNFDIEKLKTLFREVGLYSPKGEFYTERVRKHKQVFAYIEQIQSAMNKLSRKRPVVFLDCGCGKSYLSFVLYEYCKTVLKRDVKIIGVDNNPELIKQCNQSAQALGFEGMRFYAADVQAFQTDETIDMVYSLHACDTATDQTIAKGINLGVKYILSVSCCQHTNRNNMEKHPLKSITRFQPYKERLVDMIGDSMRALLLEHSGYGVRLFEFVAAELTPKNIMLRGIRDTVKKEDREVAIGKYQQLADMFHFEPALKRLLK